MVNGELKSQLQTLVNKADSCQIPSGVLVWWPDVKLPTGKSSAEPISQSEWSNNYSLLVQSALKPGWLPSVGQVLSTLRDVTQDGPVPLSLTAIGFARPKKKLARQIRNSLAKNIPLPSPPNSLAGSLKNRNAFFVSCLLPEQWAQNFPVVRARVFQIELRRDMYLTNPGAPIPDAIFVDAGQGEHLMRFGDRLTCVAEGRDEVVVKVRARWGQKWRYASCTLVVSKRPAAKKPDEIWSLSVPGGASGQGHVYRGANSSVHRRYFICCEGFPGGYPADYLVDNLNQHGLFDAILASGVDVVTIGLSNGLLAIEANADVVMTCIERAETTGEILIVGGVSMGGMITRYALLLMEARGKSQNAKAYLSIDTPHQGSRTSVSVQWFAQYFRDVVPRMRDMCVLLNSPANQQFLPLWVSHNQVLESPIRRRLFRNYERMGGYPSGMKLFAVASGRGDGQTAFDSGKVMVRWHGSLVAMAELMALHSEKSDAPVATVDWILSDRDGPVQLSTVSDYCWEGVAGSTNMYNAEVYITASSMVVGEVQMPQLTACTVPTISALDIRDSSPLTPIPMPSTEISPFDDYIFAAENLPHTAITPAMRDWVLDKLNALTVR